MAEREHKNDIQDTGDDLFTIMRYLLLFYAKTLETSNADQCLHENARRLQGTFRLFYVDNPNRHNIPIEIRQHNPDNFDNKGKEYFYRLWRKLDFDYDPWLDSLVFL